MGNPTLPGLFGELMGHEQTPQELLARLLALVECTYPASSTPGSELSAPVMTSYRSIVRIVLNSLPARARDLERSKARAAEDIELLVATPRAERGDLIERLPAGSASPAMVDLVLRRVQDLLREAPGEAFELAQCAQTLALRLTAADLETSWAWTAIARATAHLGHCLAALGDLSRADRMLEFALELFDRQGNGDLLIEAEILAMTGALRSTERRFLEAEAFFNMAAGLYEECEAFDEVPPLLLRKAAALGQAGELEQAIETLDSAIGQIDPRSHPRLYVSALEDQAYFLLAADLATLATKVLKRCRPFTEGGEEPLLAVRYHWLLGRIALTEGRKEQAEVLLSRVAAASVALGLTQPPSFAASFARDVLGLGNGGGGVALDGYAPSGAAARAREWNMPGV